MLKSFIRSRKGAVMVEYALLVAGIAIVAVVAVSVLGHKTADLLGTAAAVIPGVNVDDNDAIASGQLIETKLNTDTAITLDVDLIEANSNTQRLGNNLGYTPGELPTLVIQTNP